MDNTSEINNSKNSANDDYQEVLKLSEKLPKIWQTLSEQTASLNELSEKVKKLTQKVESLLPGATSAGLASAFKVKKRIFQSSKKNVGIYIYYIYC